MLRPWDLPLTIEPENGLAIYMQIAGGLVAEIKRGRLKPGSALPGTRAMSKRLGLNRNTVATAYDELMAQGWVTTESSRGTFVAHRLPRIMPAPRLVATARDEFAAGKEEGHLRRFRAARYSFCDEGEDSRVNAGMEIDIAFRRAARTGYSGRQGASDPRGALSLRTCVAEMLRSSRGVAAEPESILLTRGRQMALYLCAQHLVGPQTVVAVEQPGQPRAWETMRALGARVVGVPVDAQGIQVDVLRRLSMNHPIKLVYVTPHCQFPTTVRMSEARRRDLLNWASETGATILEDDFDHDFHYGGAAPLSLASMDRDDRVIYIGSFSKLALPGLRPGSRPAFLSASDAAIRRMAQIRSLIDRNGDDALERAVAILIESGKLRRRVAKTLDLYRERRDTLESLLRESFGDTVRIDVPAGGAAMWIATEPPVNTRVWSAAAAQAGVRMGRTSEFLLNENDFGGVRLAFTSMTPAELREAVAILARTCPVRMQLTHAS